MKNNLNIEIEENYSGYGKTVPFRGVNAYTPDNLRRAAPRIKTNAPGKEGKVAHSLKDVLRSIPVKDGMTLSFHSAFRNGDVVLNQVVAALQEMNIKGITISTSGLFAVHVDILPAIKDGTIIHLDTNGIIGPVADAVMDGLLPTVTTIRSHGGRPRSIESGQQHIDIAFIAAPVADRYGNICGNGGNHNCGSLGYAMPDAEYADYVVAITDFVSEMPLHVISIPQTRVDYVLEVSNCGNSSGIATGTLKLSRDPLQLHIASVACDITRKLGLIRNGYSFQCGSGGVAMAFASEMSKALREKECKAGFCVGGISNYMVSMLKDGLVDTLYDVQSFDQQAVESVNRTPGHKEINASFYANPFNSGAIVNYLDTTIIGALEIDTDFNINVLTGNNGNIMAGVGGNPDTAAGASVTIAAANLIRGRIPVVVDRVHTVCTPGESVDILVTDRGIAVNDRRPELREQLEDAGFQIMNIQELKAKAEKITGVPDKIETTDEVVAVVEYRDGTIIDTINRVKE